MATFTRYVNPDSTAGGNGTTNATTGANRAYVSMSAWEAAEQASIASGSDIAECICETNGTADTTNVVIAGWTGTRSLTSYIDIKTSAGHRHAGVYNTAKYRIELSASVLCINNQTSYTRFTGLQTSTGSTNPLAGGIQSATAGAAPYLVDSCICRATVANGGEMLGYTSSTAAGHTQTYINNIVYGASGVGGTGLFVRGNGAGSRGIIYNNTIYNCTTGFRARDANVVWKNNLAIGCTDCYLETSAAEIATYNAWDDAGGDPGTNGTNLSASTDAQIFVDATVSNFHLVSGSTAANVGVSLSTDSDGFYSFSTDVDGETRSGTWDIGADEIVSAGGTSAPTDYQNFIITS